MQPLQPNIVTSESTQQTLFSYNSASAVAPIMSKKVALDFDGGDITSDAGVLHLEWNRIPTGHHQRALCRQLKVIFSLHPDHHPEPIITRVDAFAQHGNDIDNLETPKFCTLTPAAISHSNFRPFSVRQYFCSRLVGFSGMVYSIKPSATISRIRSFSFPDTDLWPSAIANSDFERAPKLLDDSFKNRLWPQRNSRQITSRSVWRFFSKFRHTDDHAKNIPFNELRICSTISFAIFHKVAHTRTEFVSTVYLSEKCADHRIFRIGRKAIKVQQAKPVRPIGVPSAHLTVFNDKPSRNATGVFAMNKYVVDWWKSFLISDTASGSIPWRVPSSWTPSRIVPPRRLRTANNVS